MPATVSVVIPSHNRKALLGRALASVERQTRPAAEVLVVDDGSTDGTADFVGRRFPNVRCLRKPRGGVSSARNVGIRAARSSWIAFLDSDDEWLPTKLARQVAALEAEPDHALCHSDEIWIRGGVRVNQGARHRAARAGGWIFRNCLELCAISPSSAVVRRSLLEEVGLFDETLPACEDYELWLRITATHPVLYLDEPLLLKHGGHADQLSRRVEALDRYRIRALAGILESGRLSEADRSAALATLLQKIEIYSAGARKRGRLAEVGELRALASRYSSPGPRRRAAQA